ncbi:MAG TPA: ATP-binding protein [Candidatus Hydrogenedens sp.]|nr:ATP-binding protein [Candidatus Hydrogenedens sp.]
MESNPRYRTSLERKFFIAIFWVGVIPMTLTLIVAYVFAREGQWVTTKRNLTTAVRRTTEGVQFALNTRLSLSARIVGDPLFSQFCQSTKEEQELLKNQISEKLTAIQNVSKEKTLGFAIVDTEQKILFSTSEFKPGDFFIPDWHKKTKYPTVVSISTPPRTENYTITIAIPIKDAKQKIIGFLLDIQEATDFLNFALGPLSEAESLTPENIYYTIIYLRDADGISLYRDKNKNQSKFNVNYELVDSRLVRRLKMNPDKTEGLSTLLRFSSRGKVEPVLLAFKKIYPEYDLYFCAYRQLNEIFWLLHVGSVAALIIAGLVIIFFSLIGYRIVHRNILQPLSLINEGAQIIRQGDLELKLKINTGDELEEVADSFNQMASTLHKNIYKLEASEERYRNLVNSMKDGIYQTNRDGVLTLINPSGAQLLGFETPEQAIGTQIETLFLNSSDFREICSELETNYSINQFRAWVKPLQGDLICIEISGSYIRDEKGLIIGVEGIFRDITRSVWLEKEVNDRAERLKAVNIIAQTINSSLEAGKVHESVVNEIKRLIRNIDYIIIAFPQENVTETEDKNTYYEILSLFPEPNLEPKIAAFFCGDIVLSERKTLCFDFLQSEEENIAKELPTEINSLIITPLFAEEKVIGVLVLGSETPKAFSAHDIEIVEEISPHIAVAIRNARLLEKLQKTLNEVNKAHEQLNKANEELKTLDEMKTNLLSNVSHELRTPLVSVMGYTDMVLKKKAGPITETQKEYLSISLRNVEKLVNLIENLLDFSKLHKGKEELIFSTFDIVECGKIGLENIRPMAETREIELILNAEQQPILVDGDKEKIIQVFNNLLSNAVKFNKNKGTVEVRFKIIDNEVEISIIDTGIGISQDAMDKIFTRFYQVDSSSTRKYGGTGIGLSISQDIIRLHGSRIVLSSILGQGTTFSFRLPIHGTMPGTEQIYAGEITPDETHLLVELVSQDRSMSAQIRQWLLEENIDILHAAYPSTATSLALRYNPDCIILDCDEGPLGEVTIREILESPEIVEIPIILITNDEQLFSKFSNKVFDRLPRQLRKVILLSAIRYATKNIHAEISELGEGILCIDNDTEVLDFMKHCLESENYKVDITTSEKEAIEKLQSGNFRLVLLDIANPNLDGTEISKAIKTNPKLKGVSIYIITAKPVKDLTQKMSEIGADGVLQKPFMQEELISMVKTYMGDKNNY